MARTSTFPQFLSFPPEIHGLILSNCSENDETCLRLTCKYLYNSLFPTVPKTLPLSTRDDTAPLCSAQSQDQGPRWLHRGSCHDLCHAIAIQRAEQEGAGRKVRWRERCSTRRYSEHCECFAGNTRLYQRLQTWMPRGLSYCASCQRFTKRKRQHGGKCYHGRSKQRKPSRNFWTYYSHKGGFGGYRTKMWMKGFNNQSMNRFEAALGMASSRTNPRYELRERAAKIVDTVGMRYGA